MKVTISINIRYSSTLYLIGKDVGTLNFADICIIVELLIFIFILRDW